MPRKHSCSFGLQDVESQPGIHGRTFNNAAFREKKLSRGKERKSRGGESQGHIIQRCMGVGPRKSRGRVKDKGKEERRIRGRKKDKEEGEGADEGNMGVVMA